jgi:hypothetical protein
MKAHVQDFGGPRGTVVGVVSDRLRDSREAQSTQNVHSWSARCCGLTCKTRRLQSGKWMSGLETRTARNVVIVATANKLARISWTVLATRNDYQPCTRPPCFPTRRSDILNSFLGSLRFPSMRDLKTIDSYSEECLYSDCRPPTKLPLARAPRVKTYRPRSEL